MFQKTFFIFLMINFSFATLVNAASKTKNEIDLVGSENSRSLKHGGIALKAGGAGKGIEAYVNLNPNLQIGIDYLGADFYNSPFSYSPFYMDGMYSEKKTTNLQSVDLYTKYFVGNSFALTGGILYQTLEDTRILTVNNAVDISPYSITKKVNGSSLHAKFGIGNYWSWDFGLTLGCEWVGFVSKPILSSYTSSISTTGTPPSKDSINAKDSVESIINDYKINGSVNVLNLVLGYSF